MKDEKILTYLNKTASSVVEKEVEDWILTSAENAERFNRLKVQYIAATFDETSEGINVESSFQNTLDQVHLITSKHRQKRNLLIKCAAVMALIIGIGYTYFGNYVRTALPGSVTTPENAITLQFDNGNNQVIDEQTTSKVFDSLGNLAGTQKGNLLTYNKNLEIKNLVYNTLKVPYGKRFDIKLSDGTNIILNAGTSIKYPINFLKGRNREVYITGEAFFDVAQDSMHPFIVHTDDFNVRVLGTRFSISSYPEDALTNTVLVEGSVSMYGPESKNHSESSVLLTPGHRALWSRSDKNISIQEVDTRLYTSWTDGRIIFRHLPFKDIRKKLERHYNVAITNNDMELDNKLFTASFDIETIEQVFESFNKYYGVNYEINNNRIIIAP